MVYVSPADEQDIGGGGADVVDQHWHEDRGRSTIYVDALRISALAFSSILLLLAIEETEEHEPIVRIPRVVACTILRRRTPITHIFEQLGPQYTRRAFRMNAETFFSLHDMLFPHIGTSFITSATSKKKHRNGARNGLLPSTTRLGAAIRYFSGGSPYDLAVMFGISVKEVYSSIWKVMDAVNACPHLAIKFPSDHVQQQRIAKRFQDRSKANFSCCVGAIDGMLLWIEKPPVKDCKGNKCGPVRFYCGRKHKYGLNFMGTCDDKCRFLDIEIRHPGSASDYLAFATSNLKAMLEVPGFLAPGLVLFGDNAYANTPYMVTPYKGNVSETEDAFNFYHSQLRIQIECAFGRLVHRWGMLRRAMSSTIGLRKINLLMMALCRLHNFCINSSLQQNGDTSEEVIDAPLALDELYAEMHSAFELTTTDENALQPTPLLNGGHHCTDVSHNLRRQMDRRSRSGGQRRCRNVQTPPLPQLALHASVVNQGLRRPTPKKT